MNCERFESQLEAFLDGTLSDVERRAAESHRASCAACDALATTWAEVAGALGPEALAIPAVDLAGSIVERTSGAACGRAQSLLCDLVDAVLPAADAELVRSHLQNCTRCAALHATLCWLQRDLPPLATAQPDAQLTTDILRATAGMRQRRTPLHHGVRDWFARLVARPRFAWEVAYVGTLVVVLLFGTSASPFRSVPQRALAIIQVDPRDAMSGTSQRLRDLHGGIGYAGSRAWDATAGRALQASRDAGTAYADLHPGMNDALADFRSHGGELRQHLAGRNFAGASLMLQAMGGDVRALWNSWTAPPSERRP